MKKVVKKALVKHVTEETFERHMANIARSFARVEEALKNQNKVLTAQQGVLQIMLKEMKNFREDNKYTRNTLSNFVGDVSVHDCRIADLDMRVEKLELKAR